MSEQVDHRRHPRKRILIPGRSAPKLAPSKQRLVELEAAARRRDREKLRHRRRRELLRLAEKTMKLFDEAFALAVLHGLQNGGAVEAARPAPVAVDRET